MMLTCRIWVWKIEGEIKVNVSSCSEGVGIFVMRRNPILDERRVFKETFYLTKDKPALFYNSIFSIKMCLVFGLSIEVIPHSLIFAFTYKKENCLSYSKNYFHNYGSLSFRILESQCKFPHILLLAMCLNPNQTGRLNLTTEMELESSVPSWPSILETVISGRSMLWGWNGSRPLWFIGWHREW